jgi:hypothetical protein
MSLTSGQAWAGIFACLDGSGGLATPTVGPTGALYVDGVLDAETVTVSGSANPYSWSVTLTPGRMCQIWVTATIDGVATARVVAEGVVSGGAAGTGLITWTYTLTDSSTELPVADAQVWVTSDTAGANLLASGRTNSSGEVTFYLAAGTVQIWAWKAGYEVSGPDEEVVS